MIEAYKRMFQRAFDFSGRSTKSEYWLVFGANIIIGFILGILIAAVPSLVILSSLFTIATLIPGISLSVRRLHDSNKSGFNLLWSLTIFGALYVLYLLIKDGDEGSNDFGELSL